MVQGPFFPTPTFDVGPPRRPSRPMSDTPLGSLIRNPSPPDPAADAGALHIIDPEAPLGTHRRPLGNPEHAARSYLLGLRCTCGATSLAYSAAVDASESLACPRCATSLA